MRCHGNRREGISVVKMGVVGHRVACGRPTDSAGGTRQKLYINRRIKYFLLLSERLDVAERIFGTWGTCYAKRSLKDGADLLVNVSDKFSYGPTCCVVDASRQMERPFC